MAIPLAIVSTAWACGRLATLKLDRDVARPGHEVSAVGGNYSSDADSSEVVLHLRTRRGPVLWSGRPNQDGAIAASFTVPKLKRGYYTIVATQARASGAPAAGTPGRDVLKVKVRRKRKRNRGSSAAVAGSPWTTPTPPSSSGTAGAKHSISVPTAAIVGGGALFLVLTTAGGLILLGVRRTRTA